MGSIKALFLKRKESKTMHLRLNNSEEIAIMTALRHYLKEVEKMGEEKGVKIEKKTLSGLISRLEAMPGDEG